MKNTEGQKNLASICNYFTSINMTLSSHIMLLNAFEQALIAVARSLVLSVECRCRCADNRKNGFILEYLTEGFPAQGLLKGSDF